MSEALLKNKAASGIAEHKKALRNQAGPSSGGRARASSRSLGTSERLLGP